MRSVRAAAAVAALALVLAGCSDEGSRTPVDEPASTSATPAGDVAAFQTYAGLRLPAGAQDVRVSAEETPRGEPARRVTFTVPAGETEAFCADLGGQLPGLVGEQLRDLFGYTGSDANTAICQDSNPEDPRIQRRVLIVGTDRPQVTVDVIAYELPVR